MALEFKRIDVSELDSTRRTKSVLNQKQNMFYAAMPQNLPVLLSILCVLRCLGELKYDENGKPIDDRNTEAGKQMGYKVSLGFC